MRNVLLYGALTATLAAVWWSLRLPREDVDVVDATPSISVKSPLIASRPGLTEPRSPQSTRLSVGKYDAFATRDWTPPPPPAPKWEPPPPLPAPVAPPLPFRYLGKLQESGHLVVFLSSNTRPVLIRGGEVLDQQWRVEEISSRMVRFTYIPLAQTATLTIGDAL
jgi:hypothetical protein